MELKQSNTPKIQGCLLDETMPEESMALKTIKKINQKVKFYRGRIGF